MLPDNRALRALVPLAASIAAFLTSGCADYPVGPSTSETGALTLAGPPAILHETFDGLSGATGSQCQTGFTVFTAGAVSGWTASGFNAAHGVEWQAGNRAVSFYDSNALTLNAGVSANDAGVIYQVSFVGGPSVWNNCVQATAPGDGVIMEILRGNDTVLATHTYFPTPWATRRAMTPAGFTYVGDGSGTVRVRLSDNLADDRFGGAIDQLKIRVADPTDVSQCVRLGWRAYGFSNLAQCVRYVVTGKDARL